MRMLEKQIVKLNKPVSKNMIGLESDIINSKYFVSTIIGMI